MKHSADFLIIGSGIAGLSTAIHASEYGSVIMITKKQDSESNTNYAQGGIACVIDENDSFKDHVNDTLEAGAGLCNHEAVSILVHEGPKRIAQLLEWGVKFSTDKKANNAYKFHLGKEGGHHANRIVHAHDLTGRAVETALLNRLRTLDNVVLYEHHNAVELITNHHFKKNSTEQLRSLGAYVLDTVTNRIEPILAKITVLSTGGAGRIYSHTTNPAIATGDGVAMAWRAGAIISNMEFIQFHPTTLYHPDGHSFLISEALRGHGAILRDSHGRAFMDNYHPLKSLAPRDIVARAIDREMKLSGDQCVFLDIRHQPAADTKKHFPHIYKQCRTLGIDITHDLIPVVPAAHYLCGGIKVDVNGNTSIHNLYACGETACTGVHGANRLASNSLLEAVVFAYRAANDSAKKLSTISSVSPKNIPAWDDSGTNVAEEWVLLSHNFTELQSIMWDYVGIVRSTLRLERAIRRIDFLAREIENFYKRTKITTQLLDLRNAVTTARLVIVSALKRKESRGLHYTTDFPKRNERLWNKETLIVKKPRRVS